MASLQGLLKRPSKAEQLELELARQGSVARLEQLLAQRAGTFVEDHEEPSVVAEEPSVVAETTEDAVTATVAEEPSVVAETTEEAVTATVAEEPSVVAEEPSVVAEEPSVVAETTEEAVTAVVAEEPSVVAETTEEAVTATVAEEPSVVGEELTWGEAITWALARTAAEAEESTGAPVAVAAVATSVDVPRDAGEPTNVAALVPVMADEAVDITRLRAMRRRPSVLVVDDDWDPSATNGTAVGTGAEVEAETTPVVIAASAAEEPATTETMTADEPLAAPANQAAKPRPRRTSAANTDTGAKASTSKRAASERSSSSRKRLSDPPPPPRVRVAPSGAVHPRRAARRPRQPAVLAACPSCAVLLDPRPTASRRCSQCRERIVVKRLEGGVLYLTGPAAAALEAGQRRVKETARLARIRDRWLAQASAVGASPAAIERIGRVTASEEGVQAARALYLGAANRAFTAAHRERRFAEAAAVRRAHALALVREQGASAPVPDEVIALYRDAMLAELKSQREFGRDAELAAASCCEVCRVEAGLVVRISEEVKVARLPHADCPKGICSCRWQVARVAGRRATVKAGSGR